MVGGKSGGRDGREERIRCERGSGVGGRECRYLGRECRVERREEGDWGRKMWRFESAAFAAVFVVVVAVVGTVVVGEEDACSSSSVSYKSWIEKVELRSSRIAIVGFGPRSARARVRFRRSVVPGTAEAVREVSSRMGGLWDRGVGAVM